MFLVTIAVSNNVMKSSKVIHVIENCVLSSFVTLRNPT